MADINLSAGDDDFTQPASQRDEWNNYYGLAGDDIIRLVQGVAVGGPGNDVIARVVVPNEPWRSVQAGYWSSPAGVRVDLEQGWAEDGFGGRDTLIGIESVHATGASDWFRGSSGNNHFFGNGGNETMIGGAGIDGTSLPWFLPAGATTSRQALLRDVAVQVSADGQSAVLRPITGTGFLYTLSGMEYFDAEINGNDSQRFYLSDFISPGVMAEQAIAAGAAYRWNGSLPLGSPVALTYSFVTTAPPSGVGAAGFRAFTAAEQQVVRELLASTAALAGISFTEVVEVASAVGQMRLGVSQQAATRGVTWLPGQAGAGDLAGDIWMDVESMAALAPGGEGRAALLHEIGHALGLRHPRNIDPGDQWAVQLREIDDLSALSVMSQAISPDGLFRTEWGPLDVLALRYLYGSRSVSTGDTVHRLGNAQAGAQATLIDDGGIDTLDASALGTGVRLSLVPGSLSDVGFTAAGFGGIGNLALPGTTWIENAVGSPADDVLIGNSLDNRLTGGLGNDWVEGGEGVDTASFAGNRADYRVISNYGKVFVEALDGVSGYDTLLGIERLAFADQTLPVDSVSIGGAAVLGMTLAAQVSLADVATLSVLGYRWQGNGNLIAGVTGSALVLTQALVGQRISVAVDYLDAQGNAESVTSAATLSVANANARPSGSVTISGTALQGRTLLAANTLVDADGRNLDPDGTPTTQYQWLANGADIAGATASSLPLTESLVGKLITVRASFYDQRGSLESVSSAATSPVANLNDAPTGTLIILGDPALGQTLTVFSTLADLDGLGTLGYQWRADGIVIASATTASLTLGDAHLGKAISVTARYTDGHGTLETVTSATTAAVSRAVGGTAGADYLNGSAAGEWMYGFAGNDSLFGAAGTDTLDGGAGDDYLDGGVGIDQACFKSASASNTVQRLPGGDVVIRGPEGADTLHDVERAVFNDGALGFDIDGTGGKAYRLYQAAFDRVPDGGGVGFWMYYIDRGFSLVDAAANFMTSAEFRGLYGESPSNEQFMNLLYANVMNRAPDGGYYFWLDALYGRGQFEGSVFSRPFVLAQFSESSENQVNVIGAITNGFQYDPFNP